MEGHVEVTQREATASESLHTLDLTLGNLHPLKGRISEKVPPLNMHFFINCTVVFMQNYKAQFCFKKIYREIEFLIHVRLGYDMGLWRGLHWLWRPSLFMVALSLHYSPGSPPPSLPFGFQPSLLQVATLIALCPCLLLTSGHPPSLYSFTIR